MDFYTGQELLDRCHEKSLPISDIMKLRETTNTHQSILAVEHRLQTALDIMKNAAERPIKQPTKSIGGLIGGEAKKVSDHAYEKKNVCGSVLSKAIAYSMAVLEVNASMGLIVAAPTAGSAGVLPGVLLALRDEQHLSDEILLPFAFKVIEQLGLVTVGFVFSFVQIASNTCLRFFPSAGIVP